MKESKGIVVPTTNLERESLDLRKIVWQRQADESLESARRRVVRRWWLTVAILFGGFSVVMAAALVAMPTAPR
jgi:hypothetical protein